MCSHTTFSLNSIPENHALSFTPITTDFVILQETKRESKNIVSHVFAIAMLLIISCIIGLSMTVSPWILLILPAMIIIGSIIILIHNYNIINYENNDNYNDANSKSITVIVIDDDDNEKYGI